MTEDHQVNGSVWLTTDVVSTALAVAGFHHGSFEALQWNAPTYGVFIDSIGPRHVRWEFGTDPAFTLIPNFLVTGLASMVVSVAIVAYLTAMLRHAGLAAAGRTKDRRAESTECFAIGRVI